MQSNQCDINKLKDYYICLEQLLLQGKKLTYDDISEFNPDNYINDFLGL